MKKLIAATSALVIAGTAGAVELTWDFETANPFNRFTPVQWGERGADFTYGPRGPYDAGVQWVGQPIDDLAVYPGNLTATLTTEDIDLAFYGFDALYVSWAHWGDFEGQATNFDGSQLQISVNGGSFVGVDDPPAGVLNPAYDRKLVNGGTPLANKWAWCWDTVVGALSDDGRPLPVQAPLYYVEGFDRPVAPSATTVDVGWRSVATTDLIAGGYCAATDIIQFRWMFASDQLEGGQGYFIDDLRIANSEPECTIPPGVDADVLVDTPETDMGYEVNATVTRVCSDVDPSTVFLHFQAEGADTDSTLMLDNGDGTYTGEIPAQMLDTDVWYWITAHDMAGNGGSTLTYTFEVTEAITLALDDGQPFYIDPSFFAANDGRAVRFASAGGDTTYQLYKMLLFGAAEGQLDVGVWDDDGMNGNPSSRLYSSGQVSNDLTNDWWAYEFTDPSLAYDEGYMYVGFTFVTGDSLDNPLLSGDPEGNVANSQWALVGGSWANISGQGSTEGMLRIKVKASINTGIQDDGAPAGPTTAFRVHGNFPNPFNPRTVIRYDLPTDGGPVDVRVHVFDLAGRRLATLIDETQEPGTHAVTWEGRTERGEDVPSGVYFYRVEAGVNVATHKMVILK